MQLVERKPEVAAERHQVHRDVERVVVGVVVRALELRQPHQRVGVAHDAFGQGRHRIAYAIEVDHALFRHLRGQVLDEVLRFEERIPAVQQFLLDQGSVPVHGVDGDAPRVRLAADDRLQFGIRRQRVAVALGRGTQEPKARDPAGQCAGQAQDPPRAPWALAPLVAAGIPRRHVESAPGNRARGGQRARGGGRPGIRAIAGRRVVAAAGGRSRRRRTAQRAQHVDEAWCRQLPAATGRFEPGRGAGLPHHVRRALRGWRNAFRGRRGCGVLVADRAGPVDADEAATGANGVDLGRILNQETLHQERCFEPWPVQLGDEHPEPQVLGGYDVGHAGAKSIPVMRGDSIHNGSAAADLSRLCLRGQRPSAPAGPVATARRRAPSISGFTSRRLAVARAPGEWRARAARASPTIDGAEVVQ